MQNRKFEVFILLNFIAVVRISFSSLTFDFEEDEPTPVVYLQIDRPIFKDLEVSVFGGIMKEIFVVSLL